MSNYCKTCAFRKIRCEKTPFLRKLFQFFSSSFGDATQTLKFAEFALFAGFFLTLNESGIASFLFILMTPPNSKGVPLAKLDEEIELYLGDAVGTRSIKQFLTKITVGRKPPVQATRRDFVEAIESNKSALFPLVAYQIDMLKKIGRSDFWASKRGLGDSLLNKIDDLSKDLHSIIARECITAGPVATEGIDVVVEGRSVKVLTQSSKKEDRLRKK